MRVRRFDDVDDFLVEVDAMLHADVIRHTVPLLALRGYRLGSFRGGPPVFLAGYEGETLVGLVMRTHPWPVVVLVAPGVEDRNRVAAELGKAVADLGIELTGEAFSGPTADIEPAAAAWTERTGIALRTTMQMMLHRLEGFEPAPPTAGSARQAGPADLDLLVRWQDEFAWLIRPEASHQPDPDGVRRSLDNGAMWMIWSDPAGEPVSLAVAGAVVAGCSRIAPVYTPAQFERHGYGTAVTAAAVQAAQAAGADEVILFTDLANPTSNGIYFKLGFRPVERFVELAR